MCLQQQDRARKVLVEMYQVKVLDEPPDLDMTRLNSLRLQHVICCRQHLSRVGIFVLMLQPSDDPLTLRSGRLKKFCWIHLSSSIIDRIRTLRNDITTSTLRSTRNPELLIFMGSFVRWCCCRTGWPVRQ